MKPLPIVRLGHPALRLKSKPVTKAELKKPSFQKFLKHLAHTCVVASGAGIAAPQVGVNKQVIVVNVDPQNPRYPKKENFPLTVVINPKVTRRSKKVVSDWEGDLSADLRGLVPRAYACTVTGWDRDGTPVRYELTSFPARVFQHEIDHLDGIFFTDRMTQPDTLSETGMWMRYWVNNKN